MNGVGLTVSSTFQQQKKINYMTPKKYNIVSKDISKDI
jgi:hypothetical protein